jgi:phosphoribosylaminoimidazolecarboxamide formyltransferase/IMP cyclohydrolase
MRIAGMASNRGRNLLHLADRAPGGATLAAVVADHEDAPVLDDAADRGVPTEVVVPDDEDPPGHDRRLLDALDGYDVDLVCLDGYMRVLTPTFLDAAPTALNVHPSLLPAFPGDDAHEQVLDAGVRVTGCTVHVVTEALDDGPVVTQATVPVYEDDDAASLKRRVREEAEFLAYPRAVRWFADDRVAVDRATGTVSVEGDDGGPFPERRQTSGDRARRLRYGENPHQEAALYESATGPDAPASVVRAPQHNEGAKALSYNNYNDADAALGVVREYDDPAAVVVKHATPAGVAAAGSVEAAYDAALATDPMSAFGGVVALNRTCDAATASAVTESFKEVLVAPAYTDSALDVLRESDNLRVLSVGSLDGATEPLTAVDLVGGTLVQERDDWTPTADDLDHVTARAPTDAETETMLFAWRALKGVTSNAVVLATGRETVGIGAGQVSRVDAVELAVRKAREHAEGNGPEGAVLASDAFFPFPDGVEVAARAGVSAVVQPGGSVNDEDVIAACDEHDVAMSFTGHRCFRHD